MPPAFPSLELLRALAERREPAPLDVVARCADCQEVKPCLLYAVEVHGGEVGQAVCPECRRVHEKETAP